MILSHVATWDFICSHDQFVVNPLFHSESNKINAAHNTIASGWLFELQKGSTPTACNRKIYSATWSSYQRWLSTKTSAQIGWFCCNVFCSDSNCTHPLCSSFSCWFFLEGLQLLCLAAFFLEQVHNLIQLSFCCLFATSTFLPWAGSCCISSWRVHL